MEEITGRRYGATLILLIAGGGLLATLWARGRWWFPSAATVQGQEIDRLITITFLVTGLVFVLVHVLLGVLVWRFAARDGQQAIHWPENRTLELTYTLIPAAILITLISMGGVLWARVHAPAPPEALVVNVRAQQFAWLFRYPGPDGTFGRVDTKFVDARRNPFGLDPADPAGADDVVTRELHLVRERPVRLLLNSTDVIHSFFVPHFRVKKDAVPGMTSELWFTPTRDGRFEVACAELCGVGHYIMRGQVVVESQQAFDAWLAGQAKR